MIFFAACLTQGTLENISCDKARGNVVRVVLESNTLRSCSGKEQSLQMRPLWMMGISLYEA